MIDRPHKNPEIATLYQRHMRGGPQNKQTLASSADKFSQLYITMFLGQYAPDSRLDAYNVTDKFSSQEPCSVTSIQTLDHESTSIAAARNGTSMGLVAPLDCNDRGYSTFPLHHSYKHRHISRNHRTRSFQTIEIHSSKVASEDSLQTYTTLEAGLSKYFSPSVNSECTLDTAHCHYCHDEISTGLPRTKQRLDP
jgi:hypothetical protein